MVVMEIKGIIKFVNKPVLSHETLESGTRVIWCDKTINNILKRIK